MDFQKYTRPFEAEFNTKVTAKNKKYSFEKISELEIIRNPTVTHIVAGHLESAAILIDYPDEPVKLYRIDLDPWNDYTGPFNVYENCTVSAVAENINGFRSKVASTVVEEIFISPPVFSNQSFINLENTIYTIIIDFPLTSVIKQYRIDGGAWINYTGQFEVRRNCTVYANRSNENNKWSEIVEYKVTGIILFTPVITSELSANRDIITISIDYGNSTEKKYSFEQVFWMDYKGPMNFYNNSITVYAMGITNTGIETDVSSRSITEIVIDNPIINTTLSPDRSTVNININYGNTVTHLYSFDGASWINYTSAINTYVNGTVYAKGISRGLEETNITIAQITGIQVDNPVITATLLGSKANISIDYGNLVTRLYSYDQASWDNYVSPFEITENKTIYAKGVSRGGVTSNIVSKSVTGIFKITGFNWAIKHTSPTTNTYESIESICWSPSLGKYCAAGYDSYQSDYLTFYSSSDGNAWAPTTLQNGAVARRTHAIIWCPEKNFYLAVGRNNLMTSANGTAWTQRFAEAITYNIYSVCWSKEKNLFVAYGLRSTDSVAIVFTSTDAVTWSVQTVGYSHLGSGYQPGRINGVCWSKDKNMFVLAGQASYFTGGRAIIYYSYDGVTIVEAYQDTSASWGTMYDAIWSAELSLFIACGSNDRGGVSNGAFLCWSANGLNWDNKMIAGQKEFMSLSYSSLYDLTAMVGGQYIAEFSAIKKAPPDFSVIDLKTSNADSRANGIAWSPTLEKFAAVSFKNIWLSETIKIYP